MLHLILGTMLLAQSQKPPAPEEPKVADADLEKALNEDAMGASVITVSTTGDLILFDGAITVPVERPSVEECGELMSQSKSDRPKTLADQRRKADDEAYKRNMSTRERLTYVQKAMEPSRTCMALFKRKCEEIRQRVPLDARKAAVEDAKKSIDRLLAEAKVKAAIQSYLTNVLSECPLLQ